MIVRLIRAARTLAVFALTPVVLACGAEDGAESSRAWPEPVERTVAVRPEGTPNAPRTLRLEQPPVTLEGPTPPSLQLEVITAGEYQIDAAAAPMDPTLFLYQGDEMVDYDENGGDRLNARIVRFLAPGSYSVRVLESRARPFNAQVRAALLPPLPPAGAITLGEPLVVVFPDFGRDRPRHLRAAARSVSLPIEAAGTYVCRAAADGGRDARMALVHDGTVLEEDDDSGGDNVAQITRPLAPGMYVLRVWDWMRRGDMRITVTCDAG